MPGSRRSALPPPLAAGIGLAVSAAGALRQLPGRLGEMPVQALVAAMKAKEGLAREYDELAQRGEQAVARLRGSAPPATADPWTGEAEAAEILNPFDLPEPVTDQIETATPGAVLSHDELPLEDYDHLTLGALRSRLRRLDPVALVQLRDYERAHGDRLPVITMLDNRIAKLAAEAAGDVAGTGTGASALPQQSLPVG